MARGSRRRRARRARAPSCCWPARPDRQDAPGRGGRGASERWRCAARRARRRRCPTARSWRALRGYLRAAPGALGLCGPLRATSRCCCPSSGPPVAESDRATLFEALRCALATIAARSPAVILLDDLQWSDDATLELLGALRRSAARAADPRRRRLSLRRGPARAPAARPAQRAAPRAGAARAGARAARRRAATAALAAQSSATPAVAGARAHGPRPHPGRAVLRRGARRRAASPAARLTAGARGLELAGNGEIPVPETIRDAVLLRAAGLSDDARAAAEAAAVAGAALRPRARGRARRRRRARPSCSTAGWWPRPSRGAGAFRHALARDAIYEDVPWPRRRALHRRLAEALEARGRVPAVEVASHWLARARGRAGARRAAARARGARGAARLPRRGPRGAPRARAVARGRARGASASRCSSATRAARSSPAT